MTRSNKDPHSFNKQIKREICKIPIKTITDRQAVLAGVFCQNSENDRKLPSHKVKVINEAGELLLRLLREEGFETEHNIEGDGMTRINILPESIKQFDDCFGVCFRKDSPDFLSSDTLFLRAFLRGVFLCCGYCSNPKKEYRVELHLHNSSIVNVIIWMLHASDIQPNLTTREDMAIIYFKDGDFVSDFLGLIGASSAVMQFENFRAEHEISGYVHRMLNCDSGNTKRQADASANRIQLIEKILLSEESKKLPQELLEAAKTQAMNPGLSISELGNMMDPPIGKSGMNHRLKKLVEIAKGID